MSKNVQIPATLFFALCDYFLDGKETDLNYITSALEVKRKAIEKHTMYTMSKSKLLDEETREAFRQDYLDTIGVPQSYRWEKRKNEND